MHGVEIKHASYGNYDTGKTTEENVADWESEARDDWEEAHDRSNLQSAFVKAEMIMWAWRRGTAGGVLLNTPMGWEKCGEGDERALQHKTT